ncbi:MAG TPA: adenosylcobinamide amidohydrolase [Methylomirabilota bacterium]|jgi:iron complex transport system ATP-binding protein|nr:adenosylcobinamide amidohydrolase [Methylomirabilota bacterium]
MAGEAAVDAIQGVGVEIDAEAVVITSDIPLRVLSSAVLHGGLGEARAIVNLRVPRNHPCDDPPAMLGDFARRRRLPQPYVGLLTGARTELAATAVATAHGICALAVTTVGLSNRFASGRDPMAVCAPSTINTIVVVDADPSPAALVNAVITITEAKVLALHQAGIRGPDGGAVSGTSTDAVVIAATGRGRRTPFGGPASELGWTIASAVSRALTEGIRGWREPEP